MDDQKRPTTGDSNPPGAPSDTAISSRRYAPPVLTQYGRVDELVDSGVVGNGTSVPDSAP